MTLLNIVKESRWLFFVVKRRAERKISGFRRLLRQPCEPKNADGRVMIHLGCGDVVADGYINVDLKPAPHVHYIHDVTNLPFFEDSFADLVYACHVIEHFPFERLKEILWEWRRILKNDGVLRLSIPDFDKLLILYRDSKNDVESIRLPLMGSDDGYYSHLLLFNFDFIKKILNDNGFKNVRIWVPDQSSDHRFEDWASRGLIMGKLTYPISLNVEAEKSAQYKNQTNTREKGQPTTLIKETTVVTI